LFALQTEKDKNKEMAKKLYVGGLSYSTTEDTLKDAFAQAGAVETATIILDKMSGRSKGFGFVEMSTEEEAAKAIEMFNGKELDGRTLTVNEARPMTERPPRRDFNRGGGRGFGGGGGRRDNW
jgi:RNA recognition motif-containing protein